ncbi:hypothetical protein Q3G72_025969 [Acer saccharum]|nr:hypothetical protein Q3G72_025969 [Acer saccharum]
MGTKKKRKKKRKINRQIICWYGRCWKKLLAADPQVFTLAVNNLWTLNTHFQEFKIISFRSSKGLQKLQGLLRTLIVQWNQLKASIEEQQRFVGVTSLISSPVDEVTGRWCLSLDVIEQVENEVKMLETWIS